MTDAPSPDSQPTVPTLAGLPARVLLVRLSAHGDVLHTLPLLSALKAARPDVRVGWLTETAAAPLLEGHPLIDRLFVVPRKRWLNDLKQPVRWLSLAKEVHVFIQSVRDEGYLVSLDAQGLLKSAIWPWLCGIPQRIGFCSVREKADWLYTQTLPAMDVRDIHAPAARQYMALLESFSTGIFNSSLTFVLAPANRAAQSQARTLLGMAQAPSAEPSIVVLAPFTRWPSKHWITSHWQALIEALVSDTVMPVIVGSPEDSAATTAMLEALSPDVQAQTRNLVGKTDWPLLRAVIEAADVLVGLDSAPLHLADALNIPVVGIYGPTAPARTGPVQPGQLTLATQLDCQPCFARVCPLGTHACMHTLTVPMVFAAVRQQLAQPARAKRINDDAV